MKNEKITTRKKIFLIFFIDRVQFPNSYIIKLKRKGNSNVYR